MSNTDEQLATLTQINRDINDSYTEAVQALNAAQDAIERLITDLETARHERDHANAQLDAVFAADDATIDRLAGAYWDALTNGPEFGIDSQRAGIRPVVEL